MSTIGGTAVAEDVWRTQSIWSQAADRSKAGIDRARTVTLCCAVTAGVLGVAASQLMGVSAHLGRTLSFLALLAAGAAPLAAHRAAPDRVREWTRLRSVSEELKSQAYVYLAKLDHYRDPAGRDAELLRRAEEMQSQAADLLPALRGIRPADRPLPPVTDVTGYLARRLRGQLDGYYRPKAEEMARRARRVERSGIALAALAALLGAVAGAFTVDQAAAWIPVVAAISAAVVSHGASARFVTLEIEYSTTADELERLLRWWQRLETPTDADADRLAQRTEHIVSVQNEGWMAKWTAE
ncbi:DUF4231 domain-containing protein [Streptomyces sp. A012304]|uniref:DUF4231 domain-containing protein n=1 Tax=Streptomyces sp. A012304 TaxID=375446 RepID=UPI002231E69C|nr:DUF4231 domain-containing protein [Streptomyces sp. A012304]GKQ41546.1 hypothetical protein ALMP_80600 [Streptomyces sp. A012304]